MLLDEKSYKNYLTYNVAYKVPFLKRNLLHIIIDKVYRYIKEYDRSN